MIPSSFRRARAATALSWTLLAGAVALSPLAAPAHASDVEPAHVLVITGTDPYLPAFVAIDAGMRRATEQPPTRRVIWLYESVDTLRFGALPERQLAQVLAQKYEGIAIDALVLVTEGPARFYLEHGATLWPGVPAVINSVSTEFAKALPPSAAATAIPAESDFAGAVRIAFALQPRARRVLVIAGSSPYDQAQLALARAALTNVAGRAEVDYLVGLEPAALRDRLAGEGDDSIVLYTSAFADAAGNIYVPRDYLRAIADASRAPIYGTVDTFLASGMVAGSIDPFSVRGELTGRALREALVGTRGEGRIVLPAPASTCVADARELTRYGLNRHRLPDDCELRFLEPPFLQRYWWQSLLVVLALVAQAMLITALLTQRQRRRAAERGFAEQRVQLLHASRLAAAGELTASIAHEINQPLSAILSNADAAEMLVQSGRLKQDELLQILSDIKRDDLRASEVIRRLRALLMRHAPEHQRFDLHNAIIDALAIVDPEVRRRHSALESDLAADAADVKGDPIQIQQVLINLILNAVDANAERPDGSRPVRVSTDNTPDGVRIRVRDFGSGIEASNTSRLFEPFFTTKATGMGLGLAIARSIIEAHGGTISASNCEVGAEFSVTLPSARSPTSDSSGHRT